MSLGERLKQARKLLGDTQAVAGKKSGVPQSDISYMEVGKRKNIPEEYFFTCIKMVLT
ncbi:helix-turn-helix domain-containing protein [Niabella ginsengisoli]|uniref:Helix-turn-helix domain-containing protein n=1 Tax=Niabella ginsengisoli TaxID=522298 RepID=A0ABS9SMK1_9BACT|nr:helix-turn-helix transcriptional regulator [Niabella ginsengisoli]MCH5599516.1 helix-turn-helix domain-containing protein [Niabella ginsengisoli]